MHSELGFSALISLAKSGGNRRQQEVYVSQNAFTLESPKGTRCRILPEGNDHSLTVRITRQGHERTRSVNQFVRVFQM
jgi:hypothetical protein